MKTDSEANPRSVLAAVACGVGLLVGPNVTLSAVIGLFLKPLAAQFMLSRTAVSALIVIVPWTVGCCVWVAGRLVDRFGLRRVVLPCVVIYAAAQFGVSYMHSPLQVIIGFFVLGAAAAGQTAVAYVKLVSLWFNRSRAMVLGFIVAGGSGVGSSILPQIVSPIIHDYGWRAGFRFLAAFILLVGLPVMYLFLREPAGTRVSLKMDVATAEGLTFGQTVRRLRFWMLWTVIFLGSMSLIGTIGHSVAMLTERGFSPQVAADALSFVFVGTVVAQLSSGPIADRVHSPRMMMPYFLGAACGIVALYTVHSVPLLLGGALLLGLGLGCEITMAGFLCSRYFGMRHLGSIYALCFASSNFGIGIGYLVLGGIHDAFGNYDLGPVIFGISMVVAAVLINFLGPYVYVVSRQPAVAKSA